MPTMVTLIAYFAAVPDAGQAGRARKGAHINTNPQLIVNLSKFMNDVTRVTGATAGGQRSKLSAKSC